MKSSRVYLSLLRGNGLARDLKDDFKVVCQVAGYENWFDNMFEVVLGARRNNGFRGEGGLV